MKSAVRMGSRTGRFVMLLLCVLLAASALPPAARAREAETVVRVGWYESPFNRIDQFGRRSSARSATS